MRIIDNELDMLAGSIAEWCIQIECAADLVDRAELYQFYKVNKKESEIYNNLILQLKAQQDQSVTGYIKSVIKKGITFGLKSFSEFVWTKGLALSNLSFGVLFLAYFSIIGASSFPIKMLLPDVHLGWLVGFSTLVLRSDIHCPPHTHVFTTILLFHHPHTGSLLFWSCNRFQKKSKCRDPIDNFTFCFFFTGTTLVRRAGRQSCHQ